MFRKIRPWKFPVTTRRSLPLAMSSPRIRVLSISSTTVWKRSMICAVMLLSRNWIPRPNIIGGHGFEMLKVIGRTGPLGRVSPLTIFPISFSMSSRMAWRITAALGTRTFAGVTPIPPRRFEIGTKERKMCCERDGVCRASQRTKSIGPLSSSMSRH